jgi:hypothetical protein
LQPGSTWRATFCSEVRERIVAATRDGLRSNVIPVTRVAAGPFA